MKDSGSTKKARSCQEGQCWSEAKKVPRVKLKALLRPSESTDFLQGICKGS